MKNWYWSRAGPGQKLVATHTTGQWHYTPQESAERVFALIYKSRVSCMVKPAREEIMSDIGKFCRGFSLAFQLLPRIDIISA